MWQGLGSLPHGYSNKMFDLSGGERVGTVYHNSNYYIDELEKWQCLVCDREFILSEYQVAQSGGYIRCPYCISDHVWH